MKPNVFIGSSSENLNLAYAIQQNLEYDGNMTVWTQGIFKLSSTVLDDLLNALEHFDFAIFILNPDDLVHMRGKDYDIVRDNVIFELGLFIGKLGKSKVFYLVPGSVDKLHLPTDLLGYTYGRYDDQRTDMNLQAAVGTFCHNVRKELKDFIYVNLSDFVDESKIAKDIIIKRSEFWEYELTIELLQSKMLAINQSAEELYANRIIQQKKSTDREGLIKFVQTSLSTIISMAEQFQMVLNELTLSFGPSGVAGNSLEIKKAVDRLIQITKELLVWEYEVNSLELPHNLKRVKEIMKGWSNVFINQFNTIAPQIRKILDEVKLNGTTSKKINLTIESPAGMQEITEIIRESFVSEN